jgi:isoaspartyl peptidase/L-asparaginase-like protein (Ntn-hydrolase superfamily)
VHGGAWSIPDDMVEGHVSGVRAAVLKGSELLMNGGSAIDVVEKVVNLMEVH